MNDRKYSLMKKFFFILVLFLLTLSISNGSKPVYTSPIYEVSVNNSEVVYNQYGEPIYFYYLSVPPRGKWYLNKSIDAGATWFLYQIVIVKNAGFKELQTWVNPNEGTVYYQFFPVP